jgi:hypothetical protein
MKYSEEEEESINSRLLKVDKKLYYMLNPEKWEDALEEYPHKLKLSVWFQ